MSTQYVNLPAVGAAEWKPPVAFPADLPISNNTLDDVRVVNSTLTIYVWNGTSWIAVATPGAAIALDGLVGDATASGPGVATLTLATVNSNVGTFGSASSTLSLTVNAKGLITAASNTSIQIAESQVTNLVTDLAGKQATGNYITALTGDATATGPGSAALTLATVNSNVGTFASVTVNAKGLVTAATALSGDATTSGAALTLATVNSNVGSFGTATQVSTFTVNAKGLITAASSTSIQIAESQVTNLVSDLAGKQPLLTIGNLTAAGTDGITITNGAGAIIGTGATIAQRVADATHSGYLSSSDWSTFNNKLNASAGNYITNPSFEIDTSGWNLYNNSGNTTTAYVVAQDITYTAVTAGNAGNGINIDYIFHPTQPSSTPLVTVVSSTHITVAWYNGPTLANNPTATQLKAAYDAVPGAVAIATSAITGTASNRQYETGANITANGGDTAPINGLGGAPSGITFTRNTTTPLVGVASGDLGKIAASEQGQGVSTDFVINTIDKNQTLQISFAYSGSTNMVLGSTLSDVQVFIYDIGNSVLIPVIPTRDISGPVNTPKTYVGTFQSSASSNYRLILHIATTSTQVWDLLLDSVTINDTIQPSVAQKVPSLVLVSQPISGLVTDHMCVMLQDGTAQWVPATIAGAALPVFGSDKTQLGFATNIIGSRADIYIRGALSGFSFGPFTGYEQYIDTVAGGISPLPSPFTDTYVMVGMAISSTVLNIQFDTHVDLISNSSGTPLKGGLLSNSAINDGTGDQVLPVGANGNVLVANSAASLGINWAPAVVAGTGLTYTTATRSLTLSSLAGDVTGAPQTNSIAAATVTGKLITGYVSGAGTVAATDTILQSINKLNGNNLLKANSASPVFTGDVNVSTGNLLVSTIGKGIQVKTGANAKIGTAVLVGGTVTVANTSVTANSRILLTSQADGGTPGFLRITAKTAATSFVITSSSGTDTSTVAWCIVESIP